MNIKTWLTTIVGIVIIGVIVEMVIPHKRMSKIINVTTIIMLISAMFSPIILLLTDFNKQKDLNLSWLYSEGVSDEYFVDMVENIEKQVERKIKSELNVNCDIEIEYVLIDSTIEYTSIFVSDFEVDEDFDKNKIVDIIQSMINISIEGIVFNE